MRILFFGNGQEYSLGFLHAVVASEHELVGIVSPTRPDLPDPRPSASSRIASRLAARVPSQIRNTLPRSVLQSFGLSVSRIAREHDAELFWPATVNDAELVDQLELLGPDLVVMAGFTEILSPMVVDALAPIINVHPSLLPRFRGPHPEFWIISEGEVESGVTIHFVDHGIDTGEVLAQARFDIEPWLTAGELHKRSIDVGANLLLSLLDGFDPQSAPSWPQSGEGSYYSKVGHEHVVLPFDLPVQRVYDRARAATPWLSLVTWMPEEFWSAPVNPVATASASTRAAPGLARISLGDPTPFVGHEMGSPGTARRTESGGLAVACADGAIFFHAAARTPRK